MRKLNKESPHILCIDTTKRSRAESTRKKPKSPTNNNTKKASAKHELAQNRIREKPVTEEKWITLRRIAAAHAECSLTLDYVPKQAQCQHWGERDRRARIKVKPETGSSEQMEIFHFNTSAVWCFMLCHSERGSLCVSFTATTWNNVFFSPVKNDTHAATTSSRRWLNSFGFRSTWLDTPRCCCCELARMRALAKKSATENELKWK